MDGGWLILATLCLSFAGMYWAYRQGKARGKEIMRREMDEYIDKRMQELSGKLYGQSDSIDEHFTVRMPGSWRREDTKADP